MKLFERLEYLNASPADLAGKFAEYMRHDPEADRKRIGQELGAILERREHLAADLERLTDEMAQRRGAWEDFADLPGTPQQDKASELANVEAKKAAQAEAESARVEVEAKISALDLLFCEICRALDLEGLSITSGEISALKRYAIPQRLADELDTIKRGKIATIPQAERLSAEDAAALFEGLTREGLISGLQEVFIYHLGQLSTAKPKRPNTALSWLGTAAQFAYFAWRLSIYTQPGPYGYTIREKAICAAFGIDERQRRNVIRPYLADFRAEVRDSCKDSEKIKRLFDALQGE